MGAMRPIAWMAGPSIATWLALAVWLERDTSVAVFFGMLGPLAVAAGSWWVTARTFQRSPDRVTGIMLGAFAAKMVFFAVYIGAVLRGLALRPVPFTVSFTAYFIGLYAIEALFLKRLYSKGFGASGR